MKVLQTKKVRHCKQCGEVVPQPKKGRSIWCSKICARKHRYQIAKKEREENPELKKLYLEKQRNWYHLNQPARRKRAKEYRKENKEKIREQKKRNYFEALSKPDSYIIKYRESGKAQINSRKSYLRNKEKILEKDRERLKTDVEYNLKRRTKTRIRNGLAYFVKGLRKDRGTVELLGCSLSQFKEHIEKQFTKDMNWDEFLKGRIHLDHIKPIASFNLSDIEEQKKCFNYKNVQPLWSWQNLRKGSREINFTAKDARWFLNN